MSLRSAIHHGSVSLLLWASLFGPAAYAKGVRPPQTVQTPQDRSAPLVAQGVMALASRNFVAAYAALSEAYVLDHSPDTLYQLGIVAYAEGQTVVAQDLMRRYLASSSPQQRNTQQRAEAERIVSQVQGQSAELLMQGDPETQVLLNGRLVGVLPLPMPLLLSAGPHVISWKSPSKTQEKAIEVEAHRAYLLAQDSSGAMEIKRLPTALLQLDSELLQSNPAVHPSAHHVIEQSIRNSGLFVQSAPAMSHEDCKGDARCITRIAEQSFMDYLLVVSGIQAASSSGGTVSVTLTDTQIGEPAAQAAFPCSPCNETTVAESLSALLPRLLVEAVGRGRGTLRITSQPSGAMVQVGDRKHGTTPLTIPRFAGPVDFELRRPGYQPFKGHQEVTNRQASELSVSLVAEETAPLIIKLPPERNPRPKWRIAVGISSLGIGLGLIGLGGSALAVSGQCIEPAAPPLLACSRLYDTTPAGAALLGTGAALTVTGTLLLVWPGPRNRERPAIPPGQGDSAGPWALLFQ